MVFGDRLKELRKSNNMSQADLAKRTGIGASTVAEYEQSVSLPGTENLIKISKTFSVSLDYLLGLTTDKKISPGEPVDMISFVRPTINGKPATDAQLKKITKMMADLVEMVEED